MMSQTQTQLPAQPRPQAGSPRHEPLLHLLSHIGLLALDLGLDDEAERIFACQRKMLADPNALEISRAIVMLRRSKAEEAIGILRDKVLAQDPSNGIANAVLGFALQQAGQPGSRECFERVLAASVDPVSREAALAGLASCA